MNTAGRLIGGAGRWQAEVMRSRHLSEIIHQSPAKVYAYASDPEKLPSWAAGLALGAVTRSGSTLIVDSPMGRVSVRFTPPNAFGVLDHDVTLPSGETVTNPVRVLPHPEGCEIVFTVRQRDLSDAEFDRDTEAVAADLTRLKSLVETEGGDHLHD